MIVKVRRLKINMNFLPSADEDKSVIQAFEFGDQKVLWVKNTMVFTEPLLLSTKKVLLM
jgi:hypothetical protein